MTTYSSPGVYVEEVSSGVKPIAGAGTSTPGFVGAIDTSKVDMPVHPDASQTYTLVAADTPVFVTSWTEFKQSFGEISTGNELLAHAVYGFFNNGGTSCWVMHIDTTVTGTDGDGNPTTTTELDISKLLTSSDQLEPFEAIDDIAILVAPGATSYSVTDPDTNTTTSTNVAHPVLLSHCANMKDRVAILDSGTGSSDLATDLPTTPPATDSEGYGAYYGPWIEVADPLNSGQTTLVPPSGHIAGIYARSDATRGIYKAPANEIIRGAVGVEYRVSKANQDVRNPNGVNVIRSFNGSIKVWGARTISDDSEWKYVNIRRYMNYLRESIDEGTQWVVFEPNDERLWGKIRRNVSAFLRQEWANGALFGSTAEEAYYVLCDETINTSDVRDLGQVITEIGVSMIDPAEFVIFRVSQWSGD